MYEEDFSDRLAELRIKKGVSARDMSLSLGQSSGYINHIENRQILPSMSVFFNICEYFGITPKQFFAIEEKDPVLIGETIEYLKRLNQEHLLCLSVLARDLVRE
nr:helix-turn-helix transcriptional regulator [Eubacterium barkeri]